MRQDRLNHLMILHVHKERTDALDMKEVVNEYIQAVNIDYAYLIFVYFFVQQFGNHEYYKELHVNVLSLGS